MSEQHKIAVIGAGSFGTIIANLLAVRNNVYLYSRREEAVSQMQSTRKNAGQNLHANINPSQNLEQILLDCRLIYVTVTSSQMRNFIQTAAPLLKPSHLIIHGTKGFDVALKEEDLLKPETHVKLEHVKTMSEVIVDESVVKRVGCLAGPNLAKEIGQGQPAATVIASRFEEVIQMGISTIRSDNFQTYSNNDITGVEISGALKNIYAIGSGMLTGLGLGENVRALLINKGLTEMIHLGKVFGADVQSFLGLAGMGDLIATCNSPLSRNYTVGKRLAEGETLDEVIASMNEVAEGVKTIKIANGLSREYNVPTPIVRMLYKMLFEDLNVKEGLEILMDLNYTADVDYL